LFVSERQLIVSVKIEQIFIVFTVSDWIDEFELQTMPDTQSKR